MQVKGSTEEYRARVVDVFNAYQRKDDTVAKGNWKGEKREEGSICGRLDVLLLNGRDEALVGIARILKAALLRFSRSRFTVGVKVVRIKSIQKVAFQLGIVHLFLLDNVLNVKGVLKEQTQVL